MLVAGVAGVIVGATITTAVLLLRERDEAAPEPPPRPPMPSWSEEAQQIHRCARCRRKILRDHERDRQVVRWVEAGIEYYHAACWDDAAGAPRP